MEPIFTLPYSEYQVIAEVAKHLKKSDGYSIYIPTSRQQKGVDFIIHNAKSNKFARVQVKGSRSYTDEDMNYLWFGNFIDRYEKGNADFYMLYGMYSAYASGKRRGVKGARFWKSIVFVFPEEDMRAFLKQVVTKRAGKKDGFFSFGFDGARNIICNRGPEDFKPAEYLLDNQLRALRAFLK